MRRSDQKKADQLDQALDAMMRGDHSGLDELPPKSAATVSRLYWLVREAGPEDAAAPPHPASAGTGAGRPVRVPRTFPMLLEPEQRTAPELVEERRTRRGLERLPAIMRVAAIVLILVLAAGMVYSAYPLLTEPNRDVSDDGAASPDLLHIQPLDPERCASAPMDRERALEILRDVDVDRDEALRRGTMLTPIDPAEIPTGELNARFTAWQACRRFGRTYEAMTLQAPYFTREDVYGETSNDFRGPVETAYSDATLNELLDRREEADATTYRYWESLDFHPDPTWTLVLAGETFFGPNGDFLAIRAMAFDVPSDAWKVTPTVVVFQRVDGQYLLFDILTVPEGELPYQ
jgi:hypothetical protein